MLRLSGDKDAGFRRCAACTARPERAKLFPGVRAPACPNGACIAPCRVLIQGDARCGLAEGGGEGVWREYQAIKGRNAALLGGASMQHSVASAGMLRWVNVAAAPWLLLLLPGSVAAEKVLSHTPAAHASRAPTR